MRLIVQIVAISLIVAVLPAAANKKSNTGAYNECIRNGMKLQAKGDFSKAFDLFSKAISINSKNASGYYRRGKLLAIGADSARYQVNYDRAADLYNMAIADLSDAIALDPRLIDAYEARAMCYKLMNQYEAAIADFSKVLESRPKDAGIYWVRGFVYENIDEFPKAIADFDMALKYKPGMKEVYYSRGTAYYAMNDLKNALANYNKAIELNPNLVPAYYAKGKVCEDLGQLDEALKTYKKCFAIDPKCSPDQEGTLVAAYTEMHMRADDLEKRLAERR